MPQQHFSEKVKIIVFPLSKRSKENAINRYSILTNYIYSKSSYIDFGESYNRPIIYYSKFYQNLLTNFKYQERPPEQKVKALFLTQFQGGEDNE